MVRIKSEIKRLMLRKGFKFAAGSLFADQERLPLLLDAVFGDDCRALIASIGYDVALQKVDAILTGVFSGLIEKRELYRAIRDHPAFYETVASDIKTDGDFTGQDVKAIEELYVSARQNNTMEGRHENPFVTTVDAWIGIRNDVAQLPPPQKFTLASRPIDIDALTTDILGFSVASAGDSGWPPACFNEYEIAILSKSDLRPGLFGRDLDSTVPLPELPSKTSAPLDTRAYLCCLALQNYSSESKWRLTLTPVANYRNNRQRWDWSDASNGGSRVCWTTGAFAKNCVRTFQMGKKLCIGLATPWFGRPWASIPSADGPQNTAGLPQHQIWNNFCPRMGFAIVLHQHADGVELIIFDPSRHYLHLKNSSQAKGNQMAIFDFRRLVRESTEKAINEAGGSLVRGYHGGKVSLGDGTDSGSADSVQLASEWVRRLVVAGRNGGDPLDVDDGTWAQWGFDLISM